VQRELQPGHFQFLYPIDELLRLLRLQRPTANREPVSNRKWIRRSSIKAPVFDVLRELDEPTGLAAQPIAHTRTCEFPVIVQQIVDLRQKHPFRINKRISIAKYQLKLFDR